ncbi:MAG TPA: hypothetical protein VGD88_17205 [Opitutaceae bacterium]
MPATHLLATDDPVLLADWQAQLAPGRPVITLVDAALPGVLPPGVPLVVVLDSAVALRLAPAFERCPTIFVGEPRSQPFEQARIGGRARVLLSYDESRERLAEFLPLVEEVAERNAALELLMERTRRQESGGSRTPFRTTGWADTLEIWDFLEGAVENLGSRERLLGEFRRASRHLLRASHAVFFLREGSGFRADRGESSCALDDPLVAYLSQHPAVLDGVDWPGPADPVAELAVRHRLALWGARLLVPMHDNGRLVGMIAFGVRDDGQPYDSADRVRAVFVARLLRQFLAQSSQVGQLASQYERTRIGEKYLPHSLILAADEPPPRNVPLAVRALIGDARQARDTRRISPSVGQPFRASAGAIIETGGTWAYWEEASGELHDRAQRTRADRLTLLRELALTLNHEIGNALVSLAAIRHVAATPPPGLMEAAKGDIAKLEAVNRHLGSLANLTEIEPEEVDLRDLLREVGSKCGVAVEVGPDAVPLRVTPKLLTFALTSMIDTVAENRPDLGTRELSIQLRSTGEGDALTALVSIKGRSLELEGILPEPEPGSIPNQGRIGVFIAREVIRLHRGEVHAGPGLEGTEILISLRRW